MKKIVFYDTETTGLPDWKVPSDSEHQPHIVQLAAIQCDIETREIIQKIDVMIRPDEWKISEEMTKIHGISQEKALDFGIAEYGAIKMLVDLCDGGMRVAHNRTFDQRIIRIGLKRYQTDQEVLDYWASKEDHDCSMLLAKPIMKRPPYGKYGWKNPKLSDAYKFFTGKELIDAHSAMADATACMKVYWAIKDWFDDSEVF